MSLFSFDLQFNSQLECAPVAIATTEAHYRRGERFAGVRFHLVVVRDGGG